ncbi:phage major capsid protein, partial [bacterium]|nr:phage major capsid protein [bacterium]
GGYEIRKPIMYNDSAVGGFYSGMSAFNLDAIDDMTAFRFAIKQVYEPVAISGRDRRANRDDAMLLDLVESKMKAAVARLKNTVSTSLRGDGTGSGGLEFDGIKKALSTSPSSGTYGSIDRSANTWARNLAVNVTLSAANVQETITDTISQIARGDEQPDLGLMDRTAWKYLHSSLTAIQRIQLPVKKAVAGFRSLSYDGVDFVFDGGYGSAVLESNSCRLMNTKYWTFDMVRGADFKPLAPEMARPVDQDAVFTVIIVEGNLCCSAPALQAVIYA